MQAVLEERPKLPLTGPVGRALQDTRRLGWVALEGWWKWRLPGQAAPLHLALDDRGEVCHRVRESQLQALERRRPRTYGGLGGAVQRDAVRHALTVACNELELVLLRSQLAGATWTAARAHKHRIRTDPRCPHCGAPTETDEHMLWACPSWEPARAAWRPLVEAAARPLPTLACVAGLSALGGAAPAGPGARQRCAAAGKGPPVPPVRNVPSRARGAQDGIGRCPAEGGPPFDRLRPGAGPGAGRTHCLSVAPTWGGPTAHAPGPTPRWMHLRGCRRIGRGRRRFCMPCCGGQGPCCGSLARAKSRTWNWP